MRHIVPLVQHLISFSIINVLLKLAVDLSTKTTGPKEESGFTHAYNEEPITYLPGQPHTNENPVSIVMGKIK